METKIATPINLQVVDNIKIDKKKNQQSDKHSITKEEKNLLDKTLIDNGILLKKVEEDRILHAFITAKKLVKKNQKFETALEQMKDKFVIAVPSAVGISALVLVVLILFAMPTSAIAAVLGGFFSLFVSAMFYLVSMLKEKTNKRKMGRKSILSRSKDNNYYVSNHHDEDDEIITT